MTMIGVPTSTVAPRRRAEPRPRRHTGWELDDRLRGLDFDDDVVDFDGVADGDSPGDQVGLGQALAGIGELDHAWNVVPPDGFVERSVREHTVDGVEDRVEIGQNSSSIRLGG